VNSPIAHRTSQILVIGVGNEFRNDDGVGISVARKLKELNLDNVIVIEQSGEGTALMECWSAGEMVFVVDAVSSGANAGTIFRINAQAQTIPANFFNYSTHKFSLAEGVELSRALGELPAHFFIYGIEGKNFSAGEKISEEVRNAMEIVVKEIADTITSV
jgi:hydrogenase maturation protease